MTSNLRRLAADHAALHNPELPPNYLLPPDGSSADDLTQLNVLLTGPQGTPYSQGLWRLHLKMPEDYPRNPPKASFKTRIWHPNVEELSGAVCVDTLKRDWRPKLTLRDVLVTISCLLIYPNPDSALNSAAGALLQEDYDAFARQARLMTFIHAPIPEDMKSATVEAKLRGEDVDTVLHEQQKQDCATATPRSTRSRTAGGNRVASVTMKIAPRNNVNGGSSGPVNSQFLSDDNDIDNDNEDENENENESENPSSASKENNPSVSPSPVKLASLSPRKNAHGKRPLSVLELPFTPTDPDTHMLDAGVNDTNITNQSETMTASERNIANNSNANDTNISGFPSPQRRPSLPFSSSILNDNINTNASSSRIMNGIYEDAPVDYSRVSSSPGKEKGKGKGANVAGPRFLPSTKSSIRTETHSPFKSSNALSTPVSPSKSHHPSLRNCHHPSPPVTTADPRPAATSTSSTSLPNDSRMPSSDSISSSDSRKVYSSAPMKPKRTRKPRIGIRRL